MAEHRIPSLDGVRAISIGLVIVAHLDLGRHVPGLWRLDSGNLGVRIFFVISGFIITTLLLSELRQTGAISLAAFYRRRAFRILPAFYVFLAVVALLTEHWGDATTSTATLKLWPAAVFLGDYSNVPLIVGHTWSLAVEEQFYLLWPSVLLLLGLRRSVMGCAAVLVAAPIFRILAEAGIWPASPRYAFECVADALAVGCLLALARDRLWNNVHYRRFIGTPLSLLPFFASLALIGAEKNQGVVYYTVGLSALNVGTAIALDRYMRLPGTLIGRVLNSAPIVWVGLISYSLYLWQQVFAWAALHIWVKVLSMVGCGTVSYYVIEKPFQRLRRLLEARAVAGPSEQPRPA